MKVFVVVPAFREEERLPRVLATMPPSVERIVVVDDASDDGTAACASADPRVTLLRHARNRGVGAAIATGYVHLRDLGGDPRDAFVVMAGDGQMDPRDLAAVVAPIAAGEAGYVKGNRFAWPGARATFPRGRWIGGHAFSRFTSVALGVPIQDSQCGFTALARWACERIDPHALWPSFGYPNDLLGMLARANVPIAQVPVRPVYAGERSRLGLRHLPVIAGLVVRAYFRRTRGSKGSP